ncbi:D-serine deaminase-like pyridoxal phosphate-dependent protein [Friedmanniella endophytica]|uniref:D-serine deaminase-like pyridoxal phosphate-dependent protein n=1 Tax=Microlunatus kandeliicorticis TaxID=1759536 RepID=A0A7W3IU05_9ACTN|nr:alanine racemase [Microlunatus kandeliicorticis]MBA8795185.1 D-serine deaminase-like pyridoxal phosphate-dependent protein [Microlunatus kandeliicorticis]
MTGPTPPTLPVGFVAGPDPAPRLDQLATPALLVDRVRLERNIATTAAAIAGAGVALRPHVKTSKCWEVARRQLEAGAVGFTCSTPAEVSWLLGHGVEDLFWAHLPVGPAKVAFAVEAAATGRVLLEVDSLEVALPLAEAAAAAGVVAPYLLEIDTGQGRTGIDPDDALALLDALADRPSLRCRGITTHEGQLTGYAGVEERGRVGRGVGAGMVALAERLRAAGHPVEIVSVGSTPGAASVPFSPGVTEARPGTYVYSDLTQIRLGSGRLEDAALTVLGRVVNRSRDGRAILDAGTKAMSMDAFGALGGLGLVCDLHLQPLPDVVFEQGNEEHGFLTGRGVAALHVGDLVRIVPNHACGTENMWSRVHVVDEGTEHPGVSEVWAVEARH